MILQNKLSRKIALILLFGVIFVFSLNQLNQSDIFYHLKSGELIWQTKSIPQKDVFSYTANGASWVPHEWLIQLIFFGVFRAAGFWGIAVFSALLAVFAYAILFKLALKKGANFWGAASAFLIVALFNSEYWVPRPQSLAYLIFAAFFYCLESFREGKNKKFLIGAVFLLGIWANVNASFILGLAVILAYLSAAIVKEALPKIFGKNEFRKEIRYLVSALLGGAAIAMANPAGYKAFIYSAAIAPAVKILGVAEWKPITAFLNEPKYAVLMFAILSVLGYIVFRAISERKTKNLGFWFTALGVSILPFISVRHLGFWPLVAAPVIAMFFSKIGERFFNKAGERTIAAFFIVFGIVFFVFRICVLPKKMWNPIAIPSTTVDFMEENGINGPIFNLYNEGMYLIFRLWPKEKVFIDGRSEVYGAVALDDFYKIIFAESDWKNLVDKKYKINCFFFHIIPSRFPVPFRLFSKNWRRNQRNGRWFILTMAPLCSFGGPTENPSLSKVTNIK